VSTHRYLLVSRVGQRSLHQQWLEPASERRFDVLLSAYDPAVAPQSGAGVFFEYRAGSKVRGYAEIIQEHADLLRSYDYVALFDDDLSVDGTSLSRLFDVCSENSFKIAQPALTHDSYFTYASLLHHHGFRLRHVNYVEMMCPVFRSDILFAVSGLFNMGFESGIDLVWCNIVAESSSDFAVIDDVTVRHTRPVGGEKARNGFVAGKRYEDDIYGILGHFDLPWLACLPYAAVRYDGTHLYKHSAIFWAAVSLTRAIVRRRPVAARLRSVLVYWNHLLRQRARNVSVTDITG
jgi:hypothetical protein